jgi:hypothetical protein
VVSGIPVPVIESEGWVYSMWHIREQTCGNILNRFFELADLKCLLRFTDLKLPDIWKAPCDDRE